MKPIQDFDQFLFEEALRSINKPDYDLVKELIKVAERFGLHLSFKDIERIINKQEYVDL